MPLDIHPERSRVELTDLNREDRNRLRPIVGGIVAACAVIFVLYLFVLPLKARAAPIFQAEAEGTTVILTDEDCRLPEVSNLKKRAIWVEKGVTIEGCYGGHPAYPLVVAYFADKTVVVMPADAFQRIKGA